VRLAASVKVWSTAQVILVTAQVPNLIDPDFIDFFLFPKVKESFFSHTLAASSVKRALDGVTRSVPKEEVATAVQRYFELFKKCTRLGGTRVKKVINQTFLENTYF